MVFVKMCFLKFILHLTCFSSCRTKATDPLIEENSYEENDKYCAYLVKYKIRNKKYQVIHPHLLDILVYRQT